MTSSIDRSYSLIKTWGQAAPFADKIVAYQTDSQYFGSKYGYLSIGNISFGYVEQHPTKWTGASAGGEKGYRLVRLLKPDAVPSCCALIESHLKEPISLRMANEAEIRFIGNAIASDEAGFEYMFDKEKVGAIVQRNLKAFEKLSSHLYRDFYDG